MTRKAPKSGRKGAEVAVCVTGRVQTKTRISALSAGHGVGEVRLGGVVVEAAKPSANQAKRNIAAGRSALGRAKTVLLKPGVQMRVAADVPLYHADPTTPGLLVRTLNGRITRGRLVDGRFKPV